MELEIITFVISVPIPIPMPRFQCPCQMAFRNGLVLIDKRILNKRSRNLDFYYVNEHASPYNNSFSEAPHNNFSFNSSGDITETTFPATSQALPKTRERSTSINPISNLV